MQFVNLSVVLFVALTVIVRSQTHSMACCQNGFN